jgi:acyl carrier protein
MSDYKLDQVYEEVRRLILDSLDKGEAECKLSTNLIEDLGAESLDFLDIAFRIERSFSVKVQRGRVMKELSALFPDVTVKPNTEATPKLKEALKVLMPEISPEKIDRLTKVKEIATLFTVATFVRIAIEAIRETHPSARVEGVSIEGYKPEQLGIKTVSDTA